MSQQTGGRPAGSITAALFIKAFVEGCEPKDDKPATLKWAHIDIAAVSHATRAGDYYEVGVTGRPVRQVQPLWREIQTKSLGADIYLSALVSYIHNLTISRY